MCDEDFIRIILTKTEKYTYGKIVYTDIKNKGKIYEGVLDNKTQLPSGNGKLSCLEYEYEGFFENGMKNGLGEIKYNHKTLSTNILETYYKGNFKNDLYYGDGYIEYNNGDIFEGKFLEGKKKKGLMKTKKFTFEGEFYESESGIFTGKGKLLTEKYVYEGELKDGLKNGEGLIEYKNQETNVLNIYEKEYRGNFKDDLYHGKGELIYNNRDMFNGIFEQGKRLNGKLETENFIFKGHFYKDTIHNDIPLNLKYRGIFGKGRLIEKFGNKNEVELINGNIYNGKGINGNGYFGTFKNGICNGIFILENRMNESGIIFHFIEYKMGRIDDTSYGYIRDDDKIAKFSIKWNHNNFNNYKDGYTIEYISRNIFYDFYKDKKFTVENYKLFIQNNKEKTTKITHIKFNHLNNKREIIIGNYVKNDKFEITTNININMATKKNMYIFNIITKDSHIIKKRNVKLNCEKYYDNLGFYIEKDANLEIDILLFGCNQCKYSCSCHKLNTNIKKTKIKLDQGYYDVTYPDNRTFNIYIKDFENLNFKGITTVLYEKGKDLFNNIINTWSNSKTNKFNNNAIDGRYQVLN